MLLGVNRADVGLEPDNASLLECNPLIVVLLRF